MMMMRFVLEFGVGEANGEDIFFHLCYPESESFFAKRNTIMFMFIRVRCTDILTLKINI